ncbi:MAG: hypothetical protein NC408_04940 [Candidatus Gastranaerophilales bacterium]|nr:hypothetical protein [Candidatus Gastranaerophilales bacterium]MCM1073051.1 hypothetical protein [Bacteroides sp.]
MNLGIRKIALGSVAALTIAGGALTACNNKTEKTTTTPEVEAIQSLSDLRMMESLNLVKEYDYDHAIDIFKSGLQENRKQEIADSTEFVNNPNKDTYRKYVSSKDITDAYKATLLTVKRDKAEYLAKEANVDEAIKAYADSLKNNAQ